MGGLDRAIEQEVLMQVPELYRYGREQHFFGMKRFIWYMIDGVYQSAVCFFFVLYAYDVTTTRSDGWQPALYEFSTLMILAVVIAANLYNGLNTHTWTIWVFIAVAIGPVIIIAYTVIYSAIRPGWIWTYVFGNNIYLLTSPIFWFGWVFCVILSLAPRFLTRYYKELYRPTDFDLLKILGKYEPNHDYYHDPAIPGGYQADQAKKAAAARAQRKAPGLARVATDMSGLAPVQSRGFGFDQEDGIGDIAVGKPLRTYTSNSLHSDKPTRRARSGSVRRVAEAIGFPRKGSPLAKRPSRFFRSSKLSTELSAPTSPSSPSRP
jgi:phospholipid-translocating ATPase